MGGLKGIISLPSYFRRVDYNLVKNFAVVSFAVIIKLPDPSAEPRPNSDQPLLNCDSGKLIADDYCIAYRSSPSTILPFPFLTYHLFCTPLFKPFLSFDMKAAQILLVSLIAMVIYVSGKKHVFILHTRCCDKCNHVVHCLGTVLTSTELIEPSIDMWNTLDISPNVPRWYEDQVKKSDCVIVLGSNKMSRRCQNSLEEGDDRKYSSNPYLIFIVGNKRIFVYTCFVSLMYIRINGKTS